MIAIGMDALKRAVAQLGNQTVAAKAIGVTPQAVSEIIRRGKRVPAEWCIPLEQATDGRITRHDLRPDLYPRDPKPANTTEGVRAA